MPGQEPSAFAGDEDHTPSFFEWFEHEPVLESEYDAAAGALVDQIWPDPVRWYLGDGVRNSWQLKSCHKPHANGLA